MTLPRPSSNPEVEAPDYLTVQERNVSLCEHAYGVPGRGRVDVVAALTDEEARFAAREYTAPLLQLLDEALTGLATHGRASDRLRATVLARRVTDLRLHITPLLEAQ